MKNILYVLPMSLCKWEITNTRRILIVTFNNILRTIEAEIFNVNPRRDKPKNVTRRYEGGVGVGGGSIGHLTFIIDTIHPIDYIYLAHIMSFLCTFN